MNCLLEDIVSPIELARLPWLSPFLWLGLGVSFLWLVAHDNVACLDGGAVPCGGVEGGDAWWVGVGRASTGVVDED